MHYCRKGCLEVARTLRYPDPQVQEPVPVIEKIGAVDIVSRLGVGAHTAIFLGPFQMK